MKVTINGDINQYYVQMLCMIFFPGAKFGKGEEESFDNPALDVSVEKDGEGVNAYAELRYRGEISSSRKRMEYSRDCDRTRTVKLCVGEAVLAACGDLTRYKPAWGMLTGVRPTKVATELLKKGLSKTKARKRLVTDYLVIPKKAALATEVSLNEMKITGTPGENDCSVYISIPFCPTRCTYCSFVSYSSKRLLSLTDEYLEKLKKEIKALFGTIEDLGLNLKTIYIGGGTPTILNENQFDGLLGTICECCDTSAAEEFTVEGGRPDTITKEKVKIAMRRGVCRMSVNPQTLNDNLLVSIGRAHTASDFFRAYNEVKDAGMQCVNTDLIAGLPGDKFSNFSETFDKILALSPENITVHTFCVKRAADLRTENVYSRHGGDTGKCVDYSQIQSARAGYVPYYMYRQKNTVGNFENVGFSKEGYEGRYNIYMMEEIHSILSAGAGAVTKLVSNGDKTYITRLFHDKYPYEYLSDDKVGDIQKKIAAFYQKRRAAKRT